MKSTSRLFSTHLLCALLLVAYAAMPPLTQAAERESAKIPHNAFSRVEREDLAAPLREQGEIRVLVGLQTPTEARSGR